MTLTREASASQTAPRLYPDFLIVGVMKAATTALSAYLGRHPKIYLPARELHFFDRDDRYQKGSGFYQALFSPGPEAERIGEKTPTYSYHERAAERIAQFNPEMKLIWIFRNPTERAYSHYWYFVQNGQERLAFEQAVALEPKRRKDNIGYSYVDRGLYADQVRQFLGHFPRENMLFLLHEEMKARPAAALQACLRFLGLPEALDLTRHAVPRNVTRLPRVPALQWLAYQHLYQRFPLGYRIVHRLNRRRQPGYPPLPAHMKAKLDAYYAPHNAEIAVLTGLDISGWR